MDIASIGYVYLGALAAALAVEALKAVVWGAVLAFFLRRTMERWQ